MTGKPDNSLTIDLSKLNDPYYFNVLKSLLGHLKDARSAKDIQKLIEILKNESEKSIEEDIRASILPTSVSKKEGRNFYLPKEGLLVEEEVNELIDDLAGVYLSSGGNIYLLKIKNSQLFENYSNKIRGEGILDNGIDTKRLLGEVGLPRGVKISGDFPNINLFLILNDFILFILGSEKLKKSINLKVEELSDDVLKNFLLPYLKDISFTSGVYTVLSRQKKRKYYITNLTDFILKFYKNEIENPSSSIIGKFTFSFYITDKDFKDKALGLLDKFLYYLIFKHSINWKILCDMLNIFYDYNYKKYLKNNKQPIHMRSAKEFFAMMNLEKIYDWAYATGKTILEVDKENGKDYVNEIIKEIKKEELPGKFKEELSKVLHKVSEKIRKDTRNDQFNLHIHPDIAKKDLQGDEFYKVKAAVLAGLMNSL